MPLQKEAILVVGDSFGLGSDVIDAETWPAYLERMVGTQVINAAVGGYALDQIVLRAEDLVPLLRPRMLLVQTNLRFGISVSRLNIFCRSLEAILYREGGQTSAPECAGSQEA